MNEKRKAYFVVKSKPATQAGVERLKKRFDEVLKKVLDNQAKNNS